MHDIGSCVKLSVFCVLNTIKQNIGKYIFTHCCTHLTNNNFFKTNIYIYFTSTDASPVKNLIGYGPNSGDAKIILDWDTPNGNYFNFTFTVTNTSTLSYANGPKHIISNLTYHSIYEIKVETQSCGNPSTPQWITCQTGVASKFVSFLNNYCL